MSSRLLLSFIIVLIFSSSKANDMNTGEFKKMCSKEAIEAQALCLSYIDGYMDGVFSGNRVYAYSDEIKTIPSVVKIKEMLINSVNSDPRLINVAPAMALGHVMVENKIFTFQPGMPDTTKTK